MEENNNKELDKSKKDSYLFSASLIFEEKIDKLWLFIRDLKNEIKIVDFLEKLEFISGKNTFNKGNLFSVNWIGLTHLKCECVFTEVSDNKKVISWKAIGDIGINFYRTFVLLKITQSNKTLVKSIVSIIENELIDYKPTKNYFSNLEYKILLEKQKYLQNKKEESFSFESCIINRNYFDIWKYALDLSKLNEIQNILGENVEYNQEKIGLGSFLKIYIKDLKKTIFMRIIEIKDNKKKKSLWIKLETIGTYVIDLPILIQYKLIIIDDFQTHCSIFVKFPLDINQKLIKKFQEKSREAIRKYKNFLEEANKDNKNV